VRRSFASLLLFAALGALPAQCFSQGATAADSPPFPLYLGPGFTALASEAVTAATSPPFPLYLGPGFTSIASGTVASAVSPPLSLYLGSQFVAPVAGDIASAISPTFEINLGPRSERFAVSGPFSLDTRMPAAFTGVIHDQSTGLPSPGAILELYLGSYRQQATTTDGTGHFSFFATVHGDYVLRASKPGYAMGTSGLYLYRGTTISADMGLAPLATQTQPFPDLIIGQNDLTYTAIAPGTLTITAMVHNGGGGQAQNVHVRFYDANTGSGVNQYVAITPDAMIANLAPGEAKPVSVVWAPPTGHRRFYAFADPDHQIHENTTLNNSSYRDLGVYTGTPPRVMSVSSEFDGIDAPAQMGRFLSGALGVLARFTASVSDPDLDVARVTFDFDGTVISDLDGSNGWSVRFDTGTLQPGSRPLIVTAYDRTGLRSEAQICQLIVDSLPGWAVGNLVHAGPVEGGARYRDGYIEFTLRLANQDLGQIGREPLFVEVTHDQDVVLIGDTKTRFEVGVYLTVSKPMRATLPWKVSGVVRRSETLFNRDFSSDDIAVTAALSSDGQHLESIDLDYSGSVSFGTPEVMVPVGSIGIIPVSLGVSADLVLAAHAFGSFASDLTSYELGLDPSVSGQINGIARVGVKYANLEAILSPRLTLNLQLRYLHPADDMTASGQVSFDVSGKIVGTLGKPPFGVSGDLLSFQLGPWDQTIFGTSQAMARRFSTTWMEGISSPADSVDLAGPFPSPASAVGPSGQVAVAYVGDADPQSDETSPEVYFAEQDWEGTWGMAAPLTASGVFKSAPALTYSAQGNPLVVWVQNSTPAGLIPPDPSLGWLLDHQDLWWSVRSAGGWSAPSPLIADSLGPARADGLPALSTTADGAIAVWSRSPTDSALAPGTAELFAARFNGAFWDTPTAVTADAVDDVNPTVCGLRADSTLIVWLRQDPVIPGQNDLVWTVGGEAGWLGWEALEGQGGSLREPSLARVPGRGALLVWIRTETQPDSSLIYYLLASTFDELAGAWSPPEGVFQDSHFLETPVVRLDARGIAAVVWRGYAGCDGDLNVALKDLSRPGTGWTQPRLLTDDALTDWMTTAVIDGQNNLHVIDLKSDLNAVTGISQPNGNFVGGLSIASSGIARDLSVSNDLNFGFRPLSCDLRLIAGSVYLTTATPIVGDTVTVQASVQNIGDSHSSATTVQFFEGSPDSGGVPLPAGPITLPAIAPDSSEVVGVQWVVAPGSHQLYAVVDPDGTVPEQTESNNRAFVSIGIAADVVVDSLRLLDSGPIPGAQNGAIAYLRNGGGAPGESVTLQLTRGAIVLQAMTASALSPGQVESIVLPFSSVAGVDTLVVVADPDSASIDADRTNNRATVVLRVLPDLAVPAGSISYSATDTTLSTRVENIGSLESGEFDVLFFAGDPLVTGELIASKHVDALSAFNSMLVSVPWHAPLGTTTIYVVADQTNLIEEQGEANNQAYQDVVSSALADLAVVANSIAYRNLAGSSYALRASITNVGTANALAVGVEFFRGDPMDGGALIADRLLTVAAEGETLVVEVPWTNPDSVSNQVFVSVDRANAVPELSKANNSAQHLFGALTAVDQGAPSPARFLLHTPRPNPFVSSTEIRFDLPVKGRVRLVIYDVHGRLVRTVVNGELPVGFHSRTWSGVDDHGGRVAAGVYFARLESRLGTRNTKFIRLR